MGKSRSLTSFAPATRCAALAATARAGCAPGGRSRSPTRPPRKFTETPARSRRRIRFDRGRGRPWPHATLPSGSGPVHSLPKERSIPMISRRISAAVHIVVVVNLASLATGLAAPTSTTALANSTTSTPVAALAVPATTASPVQGGLGIPSNGSDGPLVFTPDTPGGSVMTINLALAAGGVGTGLAWDSLSPVSGRGIYDWEKWAVVFHYTTVDVPVGKTIQFSNHPSSAPVVWLVQGSVLINGSISVSGEAGNTTLTRNTKPGPGGFRGGTAAGLGHSTTPSQSGLGPGGGRSTTASGSHSTIGSFGVQADRYGNPVVLPLIGGSGGAGSGCPTVVGGAGAGAIMIGSNTSVEINGSILARGGDSFANEYCAAGAGSGGGVRILCDQLLGVGTINATGGNSGPNWSGGHGRIRLESVSYSGALTTFPRADIGSPGLPALTWAPSTAPTARIISIGGSSTPLDPRAILEPGASDVTLPNSGATVVTVECTNVPIPPASATVLILIKPKYGSTTAVNATYSSGSGSLSTWTANVTLPTGFVVFQAHVSF